MRVRYVHRSAIAFATSDVPIEAGAGDAPSAGVGSEKSGAVDESVRGFTSMEGSVSALGGDWGGKTDFEARNDVDVSTLAQPLDGRNAYRPPAVPAHERVVCR